jgi:hypothetical protein
MVDTTNTMGRQLSADAGAPDDVVITPAMLRAGADAACRCLDESSVSFCELVATSVFRAMDAARDVPVRAKSARHSETERRHARCNL